MKIKQLSSVFDKYISPIFFTLATALIWIEFFTRTNFVADVFKIHYVKFFIFSSLLVSITLIKKSKKFYNKYYQKIIFLLPIAILTILALIFMRYNLFFMFLRKEDSIVEWLQFIFIAISSVVSFLLHLHWKRKNKILSIIFFILALGLFLVAGEEISWGQRIFNFQTPDEYKKLNTQGETTLHNYGPVFGLVYRAYMLIGLLGTTGWIFKPVFNKIVNKDWNKVFQNLIPDWQYSSYFATAFFYNLDRFYIHPRVGMALWEEIMELILFLGVALFFLTLYLKTTKNEN